jgi:hypothetical protein
MLPRWLQNILCNVSGQLYCTCGLQHSFDGLVKRRLPLHSYFNDCHSKVRACDTCTLVTLSRQCSSPKAQNPVHTPPRTASRSYTGQHATHRTLVKQNQQTAVHRLPKLLKPPGSAKHTRQQLQTLLPTQNTLPAHTDGCCCR